ncbi:MAG: hypothetical protein SP1CHLAM54_09550 [Chlamydiia bacterium]|nr:hypothetical protein [Chlamydiia bacterium]MCH9615861.1 hypothetical protein [Chlamydiia bacterium]MCH9628736.1 hypothetical protein [Chlamydiia bacterium]
MRLLWLLLTPLLLIGENALNVFSSLEASVDQLVHGAVNPITGDYVIQEADIVVSGIEPIVLTRAYVSSDKHHETAGWTLNPQIKIRSHKIDGYYSLIVYEPSGAYLIYIPKNLQRTFFQPYLDYYGTLQTGRGETQSALTNLARNVLVEVHKCLYILQHADGTFRHYRSGKSKKSKLRLEKEVKPNGNVIRYQYVGDTEKISRIESLNPHETILYAWVDFIYHTTHNDDPAFDVITSDGKRMTFNTTPTGDGFFFTDFHLHNSAHESLSFSKKGRQHLIHTRRFGKGRKIDITYYEKGLNRLPKTKDRIEVKEHHDPRNKRVAYYKESRGSGDMFTQTVYHYFTDRNLTNVIYTNDRSVIYKYDHKKRLTEINAPKLTQKIHYNKHNISRKEFLSNNAAPLQKDLEYDLSGNVIRETLRGDLTGNNTTDTFTIETHYDLNHLPFRIIQSDGITHHYTYTATLNHVTSHTITQNQETVEKTTYDYDDNYLLIKETHTAGPFTHIKHITRRITAPAIGYPDTIRETYLDNGQEHLLSKKQIHYNHQNLPIKTDYYDANDTYLYSLLTTYDSLGRTLTQTDPLGRISTYTYDEFSNLTSEKRATSPNTLYYTYDTANNLISTQEDTQLTHYTYDTLSQKISETTPQNHTISYSYDTESNPITITDIGTTHTTYGPYHNPTTQTDPLGNTTTTTYTSLAKPHTITDPLGHTTTHTYNLNQTLATTTTLETITSYTYDYKQRPTSITITDHNNNILSKETTTYNYFGPTSHTDTLGHTTHTTYDAAGRPIKTQKHTHITETTYDAESRPHIINTNGRITQTTYDIASRPITIRETDNINTTHSLTQITYDPFDNKTTITTHNKLGPSTDTYTYDNFNRETTHTNPLGHTTTTTYQDKPYTIIQTNPNNVITTTTHTPHGKPHTITTLDHTTTHTYDLADNLIETLTDNPSTTQTYTYTNNLLTAQTHNNKTTTHTYDTHSRRISTTLPNQTTIHTTYNPLSQPIHITSSDNTINTHNTFDAQNNLLTSTTPDHSLTRTYDPLGNLLTDTYDHITIRHNYTNNQRTTLTLPHTTIHYTHNPYHLTTINHNNLTHTYTYDTNHNLIEETNPLTTITHTINPANQRISTTSAYHTNTITSLDPVGNILSTNTSTYTYTPLNQIASETGPFTNTYTLNNHNERLETNNEPHLYSTDHELLATPTTTHTYDPNGNRTSTNTTHYTYDALGRLLSDGTNTYTYDHFNRRLTQNDTYYLYDNNLEVGRENHEYRILGTGFGADIGATTFIYLNNTPHIPFHDLFGNITSLYTLSGELLESYTHNPFGLELTTTTPQNPYRYQSKRHDNNLIFFGRRLYDPHTATWLTPDPLGSADSPNLYQYLHHNPLTSLDRFGYFSLFREDNRSFLEKVEDNTIKVKPTVWDNKLTHGSTSSIWYSDILRKHGFDHQAAQLKRHDLGYVGLTNGINTSFQQAVANVAHLSRICDNSDIRLTYNTTHGIILDLFECGHNLVGHMTEPVQEMIKDTKYILSENPNRKMLKFLHSHGAIQGTLAQTQLPEEMRQRMTLVGIAPGAYLEKNLASRVNNYRCNSDGVQRGHSLFGHMKTASLNANVVELKPMEKGWNHSFQCEVYEDPIRREYKRFMKELRSE